MLNPGIDGNAGPGFRFTQSGLRLLAQAKRRQFATDDEARRAGQAKP
jgi:hypothetical protein